MFPCIHLRHNPSALGMITLLAEPGSCFDRAGTSPGETPFSNGVWLVRQVNAARPLFHRRQTSRVSLSFEENDYVPSQSHFRKQTEPPGLSVERRTNASVASR
jgi:hypothetical protein